jgi:hypothetical protein
LKDFSELSKLYRSVEMCDVMASTVLGAVDGEHTVPKRHGNIEGRKGVPKAEGGPDRPKARTRGRGRSSVERR